MFEQNQTNGQFHLVSHNRDIQGEVHLPGSKSESNRALMVAAYGGFTPSFDNISVVDDTVLLQKLLDRIASDNDTEPCVVDCGNAGSVCRFLLTYLTQCPGRWVLTGSERLKQRPIEPLVTALKTLGADIRYAEKNGALPLFVRGGSISGGVLNIDGSLSSQFASSLLMAAPSLKKGLELHLEGDLSSLPYIDLTLSIMRHFGAEASRLGRVVVVKPGQYVSKPFHVSSDWSSASHWYEIAALSQHCDILLEGLDVNALQGDAVIRQWAERFGVTSSTEEHGVRLTKTAVAAHPDIDFDFSATPDLFPAVTATCAALRLEASFSGLSNLMLKESDRLHSMMRELMKTGAYFIVLSFDKIGLRYHEENRCVPTSCGNNDDLSFRTYSDHRIAMALAPLAMLTGSVLLDEVSVVSKSYPNYWKDLENLNVAVLQ